VEKQAKEEQLGALEFGEDFPKLLLPAALGRAASGGRGSSPRSQRLQVLDGHQGMLVHGVAVVEIADDQTINDAEFREERRQQAQAVHGTQRISRVRLEQDATQGRPEAGKTHPVVAEMSNRLFHPAFGVATQLDTMASHHLKKAQ
jgi:hypothetical protein